MSVVFGLKACVNAVGDPVDPATGSAVEVPETLCGNLTARDVKKLINLGYQVQDIDYGWGGEPIYSVK